MQHHHAHLAACLAEHGETGPAVGAIFDGTGLGTDGTVWGGELLVGDLRGFERAGSPAPGAAPRRRRRGPRAVADGVRVARRGAGARAPARRRRSPARGRPGALARGRAPGRDRRRLAPSTTSAGRLFDAVAALVRRPRASTYEGQAAIELEAAADRPSAAPTRCRSSTGCRRPRCCSIARPAIGAVAATSPPARTAARRRRPRASTSAARRRHGRGVRRGRGRAAASSPSCSRAASSRTGCCSSARPSACGGRAARARAASGCRPTTAAISFGQAAVAAARGRAAMSFDLLRPVEALDDWLTALIEGAPLLSRSASPSCSACGTPPTPTTSSRSPRSSPPTAATCARAVAARRLVGRRSRRDAAGRRPAADRVQVAAPGLAGERGRDRGRAGDPRARGARDLRSGCAATTAPGRTSTCRTITTMRTTGTCARATQQPSAPWPAHPAAGDRDRPPARPRRHRRGRRAADRRAARPARGGRRARGLRPDVDPLDGRVHERVRVGADPTVVAPLYRTVLVPALGAFGLLFGLWYAGLT